MRRQIALLALAAVLAGSTGCATNALRDDGPPVFGSRAWDAPPAPPQRPVKLTADTNDLPTDHPSLRQRLADSLSSLSRKPSTPPSALGSPLKNPDEPPALASTKTRSTWFGLRPQKPVTPTTYMTDAREQLNRPGQVPTTLPVALQVPATPPAEQMVRPTGGPTQTPETKGVLIGAASSALPDFGGKPSAPGEDEVNPLPPAAEPGTQAAMLNRIASAPDIEPETPGVASSPENSRTSSPDAGTVRMASLADDKAEAAATPPTAPTPPTAQVMEAPKSLIPTASKQTVLASPQGPPPVPTSQTKPSPPAKPSPQAQPSSQCDTEPEKTWRRPCLRRLVRKVCHLGEFADPPTAAPH